MKFLLAPMATLSTEALRNLIFHFGGCDEYYCEMIQAASLVNNGKFEKYYLYTGPEKDKIVWQLTDSKENSLQQAAEIVSQIGGIGIDINMGCPAPEIYNQGAGCAWMNKPLSVTSSMLKKIKSVLDNNSSTNCKRLSTKIRLGEEDFTLDGLFTFVDMLISEGVTQIVLHPRTHKEKYTRKARWEYVNKLSEYFYKKNYYQTVSLIGNGCVDSLDSAQSFITQCPNINGLMLGRSAVQKPWLFKILSENFMNPQKNTKNELTIDLLELANQFMENLREVQPIEFWKTRTQRFFMYYCDNFQFGNYLKTQLTNANGHDSQLKILQDYFLKMPSEQFIKIEY